MAFVLTTGDVVELTVEALYQGSKVLNVFHYEWGGPITTPTDGVLEVTNLIDEFSSKVWNPAAGSWRARVTADYQITRYKAQVVFPTRKHYIQKAELNPAGAAPAPGIPSDTNLTISIQSERAGRGTTGNKKFTGLPLSTFSNALFATGEAILWAIVGGKLISPLLDILATPSWTPIVWSKKLSAERAPAIGISVQPEVRVLRRRQSGKGV